MLFWVYDLDLALFQNETEHLNVAILRGTVAASAIYFSLQFAVALATSSGGTQACTSSLMFVSSYLWARTPAPYLWRVPPLNVDAKGVVPVRMKRAAWSICQGCS